MISSTSMAHMTRTHSMILISKRSLRFTNKNRIVGIEHRKVEADGTNFKPLYCIGDTCHLCYDLFLGYSRLLHYSLQDLLLETVLLEGLKLDLVRSWHLSRMELQSFIYRGSQ